MTLSTSPRSTPTRCQAVTLPSHSDGAERLRRLACTAGQLVLIVETRASKERNRGPCLLQRSIVTEPSITLAPATSCPTFGMHPCWCVPAASLWTANSMASSSVGVGHSDAKMSLCSVATALQAQTDVYTTEVVVASHVTRRSLRETTGSRVRLRRQFVKRLPSDEHPRWSEALFDTWRLGTSLQGPLLL